MVHNRRWYQQLSQAANQLKCVIHIIRAFFRNMHKLAVRKQSQCNRDITRTNGNLELSQNSDCQRKIVQTWTSLEVPLMPYAQWIFHAKHIKKSYSEFMISYCKLLDEVNKECDLGHSRLVLVRRFFYDAYSRCVDGSIFDGLKMDMVTFGINLLGSKSPDEKLVGARILQQFSMNSCYLDDTLQKIG
ncbi:hypothetical protein TB2_009116 [Malus domestica]|uniref:Uncharacterized protein n=1 Tax=Malus domestica TaxID=3750 RepID=A0A498IFX3_MALDO|nr:hypothetical protein DVH24_004791 [Malus domestica]